MLRKLLVIMIAAAIGVFSLGGCKEKSDEEAAEDYAAEAKEEINQENRDAELDAIEKAMEEDISAEP